MYTYEKNSGAWYKYVSQRLNFYVSDLQTTVRMNISLSEWYSTNCYKWINYIFRESHDTTVLILSLHSADLNKYCLNQMDTKSLYIPVDLYPGLPVI